MKRNLNTANSSTMHFCKVAGSAQLIVDSTESLRNVLNLDEAHWALTSLDIDSVCADRKFLNFLDDDRNGIIRPDEIQRAIRFLLDTLKDYTGVNTRSDQLRLDWLNTENPDGAGIREAAELILETLDAQDKSVISIEETRGKVEVLSAANNNGDGVITPDVTCDEPLQKRFREIMAVAGTSKDLSGNDGIGEPQIAQYEKMLEMVSSWRMMRQDVLFFGEKTADIFAKVEGLSSQIDDFFLASETLHYFSDSPARISKQDIIADIRNPEELRALLAAGTIAEPRADQRLDFSAPLNPLYAEQLRQLAQTTELQAYLTNGTLERNSWERLRNDLRPFGEWQGTKPTDAFDNLSDGELNERLNDTLTAQLRDCCQNDSGAAGKLNYCDALQKLLYLQRDLPAFLNNYVNLSDLFNPEAASPLQAGKLILDGRHFTLTSNVKNLAEHKMIALQSDICVVYVEITSGPPNALKKRTLAVAVTSGNIRNLFVGKRGIFFTPDNEPWDAKVIDFIRQPVSIGEALQMPFFRMGEFVTKQADKFFSTQSNNVQKNLANDLSNGKLPDLSAQVSKAQPPALSGSMMLMGGGIGIAAIGSSIAFIVKSLQNISVLNVLVILFGILVVFGGPMVVISLVKLFRRNMSRFLEANAFAVNRPMRLSQRMGRIFSFTPPLPQATLAPKDIIDFVSPRKKHSVLFWLVLLLLLTIGAALYLYRSWFIHLV